MLLSNTETNCLQHVPFDGDSFFCKFDEVKHPLEQLHSHKEYELILTIGNEGLRIVGDNINPLLTYDLVLVGPDLPHCWRSNNHGDEDFISSKSRVIKIQFKKDFIGDDFFAMPEMKAVKDMLLKANRGVQFDEKIAFKMEGRLLNLADKKDWFKVIDLLAILCELAENRFQILASEIYAKPYLTIKEDKISSIYNYLLENHHKNLTLQDVANFANMNTSSFCRYLKKATSKTLSDILNIIRIGVSCKKLLNTNLSIGEIGYACGYQSISYFNRQFRSIKNLNPSEYRLKYMTTN